MFSFVLGKEELCDREDKEYKIMNAFDKIMTLPGLRVFGPIYKKYKEQLLYLFFGFLTFLVSIGSYAMLTFSFKLNELVANIFSWIIAVSFAFFTNRIWVFNSSTKSMKEFFKQMGFFFAGRFVTLVIEEVILGIFITLLSFPGMLVKIIAQIIVIVLNYYISKFAVFKKLSC